MSAALQMPPNLPLSPEYRGMARGFYDRVLADDPVTRSITDRIFDQMSALNKRGAIPRAGVLEEVARTWREDIPTFARIRLDVALRGKTHLAITEMRLCSGKMKLDAWDSEAPAVVVLLIGLVVGRRTFRWTHEVLGAASLHALGRHYHRAWANDDASMLRDLETLATAAPHASLVDGAEFSAPLPDGSGRWVGVVQHVTFPNGKAGAAALAARSFLNS